MVFTLFIGFVSLCIGALDDIVGNFPTPIGSLYLFAQSHSFGFYSIFLFLAPLICSIPYALSYIDDYENEIQQKNVYTTNKKKYFLIKFCVNSLIGGLSLALIVILYYIFILIIKGINPNDIMKLDFIPTLEKLISNNQYIYVLIESICAFAFGCTFANITLTVSILTKDKWISLGFPILFHMSLFIILSNITPYFDSVILYSFFINQSIAIIPRLIYFLFLNILCILLCYLFYKKSYINAKKNISLIKLIIYCFIFLLIYFKFKEFLEFYSYSKINLFKFYIFLFNDIYIFHYFISFCFIIFIGNIINKVNENINIKLALKDDIKKIINIIIKFLIFFLTSSTLIYIYNQNINIFDSISYLDLFSFICSMLLIGLYLFTISLICIIINNIFKNQMFSITIISSIIAFNIAIYIGEIYKIKPFSIVYNSLFISYMNSNHIIPIVFWTFLIVFLLNIYLNYSRINN